MKLSKRIEEFAGQLQNRSHQASDSRSEMERIVGVVFGELSQSLFALSTDLEHDEEWEESLQRERDERS